MTSTALSFSLVGEKYVATATASDDFNIHLEFADGEFANTSLHVKTAGTKYGGVDESNHQKNVYEYEYQGVVYPKYVKVECDKQPVVGYISVN